MYSINHVVLNWEVAYGKDYRIEVSMDGTTWNPVFSVTNGNGGIDDLVFGATNARYVRMWGTTRGTPYGYSLYEFEIYGATGDTVTWLPQTNWSVWSVDSEELVGEDGSARNAFDGDPATFWHTQWKNGSPTPPHELQISLGGLYAISGLRYLPRQDGDDNGRIRRYAIYVSTDGATWGAAVTSGTFQDTAAGQEVSFAPVRATHVRLVALDSYDGDPWTSVAELKLLGDTTSSGATGDGTSGGSTSGTTTTVTRTAPVTGTATTGSLALSWTAPVARADGTPLSLADIDGYRIHYGKSSGNYTSHFTLADGTAQKVTLTGLPVGTCYLVMTTYDVDGRESGYSSEVSKIVQ